VVKYSATLTKNASSTAHILGNGSSIELFDRSEWPEDHTFVGCNFSDDRLRVDYTVMMDVKALMKFYSGHKISMPLIISDRCEKYIEVQRGGWDKIPQGLFSHLDTIPMIHHAGSKFPLNSGHHATLYAIKANYSNIKNVHLWGFDTFWSDNLQSNTDSIVDRTPGTRTKANVAKEWREFWVKIFSDHPNIMFTVHSNNLTLSDYFTNKCKNLVYF
jgi:hypothetical protein